MHELNVTCKIAKNTEEITSVIREVDQFYSDHCDHDGYGICDYYNIGRTVRTGKIFDTEAEARDYAYTYGMDHEVTAVCQFRKPRSSKYITLEKRIDAEKKKLNEYKKTHSVKAFKSASVGCDFCKSKLTIKFLKDDECPVCGNDLRSKTTLDTINKYSKNIYQLSKELKDEEKTMKTQKTKRANDALYYMVGVFVNSHS